MFNRFFTMASQFALSQAAFSLLLRIFSPKIAEWSKNTIMPVCKDGLLWFLNLVTPVLPSTWVPKVDVWVKRAVRQVEENWPDAEKVRFILRLLHDGKVEGVKEWATDKVEEAAKKGWEELKQNLSPEALELLDAARKAGAIDLVKEAARAAGVPRISASVISAKIDRAVAHENEKKAARSIEDLIAESKVRQEKLRAA